MPCQAEVCMFKTPSLDKRKWNLDAGNALVNRSASWLCVETCKGRITPSGRWWRTTRQSISVCLVLSWKTGFAAIWRVALLSQNNKAGWSCEMVRSQRTETSQTSSQVVVAIVLYSASADDLDTVGCFLDFQEIKESLRKKQQPAMDLRVSGQVAQSESEKAFKCRAEEEEKMRPCPGVGLRYRKTRWIAWRWNSVGLSKNWLKVCMA